MYEAYWKLNRRPFDDGAAPRFYYPSATHQASLLKLRYLIEQNKGIGLIVGDHGLGKTYLTQVLEDECRDEQTGPFIRLVLPALSSKEMLAYLANRLGADIRASSGTEAVLLSLEGRLQEMTRHKQHPVLILDDAHLLEMEQLHLIRLLLNIREGGAANFSVILLGRTDLLARVKRLKALDQRIAVRMALQPLNCDEVSRYTAHRLEVAGTAFKFDSRAGRSIWELSQGIPRRINQVCDLALLVGYVDQLREITPVEIKAAAEELICVQP